VVLALIAAVCLPYLSPGILHDSPVLCSLTKPVPHISSDVFYVGFVSGEGLAPSLRQLLRISGLYIILERTVLHVVSLTPSVMISRICSLNICGRTGMIASSYRVHDVCIVLSPYQASHRVILLPAV